MQVSPEKRKELIDAIKRLSDLVREIDTLDKENPDLLASIEGDPEVIEVIDKAKPISDKWRSQ